MSFSSEARKIAVLVFGLALTGSGGFFLWTVMQAQPVDRHLVYLGAGWIAVGCLVVAPRALFDAMKKLASLLPSIKIGGGTP